MTLVTDVWRNPNEQYVPGIIVSYVDLQSGKLANCLLNLAETENYRGSTLFAKIIDFVEYNKIEKKILYCW